MNQVMFDFTGMNFIITGASSGIGRQIAIELAESGAKILAIARNEERLKALQQIAPMHIFCESCDVTDKIALEIAINQFVQKQGKIHGCVHAAGISGITPIKLYDENFAQKIMAISFWAGMDLVQICTKNKYAETGASHILFSSVCAYSSERGMFAYTGAKAAVNASIKSVAKEISTKKHRINAIVPGWVKTNMTEQAKQLANMSELKGSHLLEEGNVEDISGVVLFLLSDRAKWITGTSVIVDGGYLA